MNMRLENYAKTVDNLRISFKKYKEFYLMNIGGTSCRFMYSIEIESEESKKVGYLKAEIEKTLDYRQIGRRAKKELFDDMIKNGIILLDKDNIYWENMSDERKEELINKNIVYEKTSLNGDEWVLVINLSSNRICIYHKGDLVDGIRMLKDGKFNYWGTTAFLNRNKVPLTVSSNFLSRLLNDKFDTLKIVEKQ